MTQRLAQAHLFSAFKAFKHSNGVHSTIFVLVLRQRVIYLKSLGSVTVGRGLVLHLVHGVHGGTSADLILAHGKANPCIPSLGIVMVSVNAITRQISCVVSTFH